MSWYSFMKLLPKIKTGIIYFLALFGALFIADQPTLSASDELYCAIVNPDIGTPEVVRTAFKPLFEYLSKKVKRKIIVVIRPSVQKTVEELKAGKIDFGYTGIVDYFKMGAQFPIKPALTFVKWGKNSYTACFTVRSSDRNLTLKDFKGRRLGYTSFHKTFGGIYPQILLTEQGVKSSFKEYFSHVKAYYSDVSSLQDLLTQKIDVCVVSLSTLKVLKNSSPWLVKGIVILYKQEGLMFAPIFYRADMDEKIREGLISGTIEFFKTTRGDQLMMMFKINGVQRVTDEEYEPDRQRALKLGYIPGKTDPKTP
ncbi:phosphate/phosphite/phosphonate ABC transporter substrate-binding protein [candidate division CSSED10-310 bacterium]|uniref:Phosphate/phosphite/phosphonate ABC transporter substrate-binding protein n=1 Tax=candidate division CSSED10-310 bacterium TaxID=2855610 RepID=A0ABV6YZ42_UNCC1